MAGCAGSCDGSDVGADKFTTIALEVKRLILGSKHVAVKLLQ
jgi:hypothetical protein